MAEFQLGSEARPLRVAVIGSGPSGFYAVQAFFKTRKKTALHVSVDLFDRLPTPYGLVRGGVAPDHQKIKNVIKIYDRIANEDGFRFFGNVVIGRDLRVEDLMTHYDQVVYATGNESDRRMGMPGEDLAGVHSATEFVGWYNGHPDFRDREFDLKRAERVAVVGNGNVAMDVTRVLARDPEELAPTDIADYAVEALRESTVREILLLGRRGPAQAAFSPKEIKEVASLSVADLVVRPEQMALDELTQTWLDEKADRDAKKNVAFLTEHCQGGSGDCDRKIQCEFLASPVEFVGKDGVLTGVRVERNELYEDSRGTPRPRGTGEIWEEPVQLVFKAIGYRGVPIDGIPFREDWGIFPNDDGRLLASVDGPVVPNQYVVGWCKRGPTGLIGTNAPDSAATVRAMLEDIEGVAAADDAAKYPDAIVSVLRERGVDFVSYEDWQRLDEAEVARGEAAGKIREKYTRIDEMMAAIRAARA